MLANDGNGVPDREKLRMLMPSLRGSRLKIYKNLIRFYRKDLLRENPGKVYDIIKTRLMEFQETIPEKAISVPLRIQRDVERPADRPPVAASLRRRPDEPCLSRNVKERK